MPGCIFLHPLQLRDHGLRLAWPVHHIDIRLLVRLARLFQQLGSKDPNAVLLVGVGAGLEAESLPSRLIDCGRERDSRSLLPDPPDLGKQGLAFRLDFLQLLRQARCPLTAAHQARQGHSARRLQRRTLLGEASGALCCGV